MFILKTNYAIFFAAQKNKILRYEFNFDFEV